MGVFDISGEEIEVGDVVAVAVISYKRAGLRTGVVTAIEDTPSNPKYGIVAVRTTQTNRTVWNRAENVALVQKAATVE